MTESNLRTGVMMDFVTRNEVGFRVGVRAGTSECAIWMRQTRTCLYCAPLATSCVFEGFGDRARPSNSTFVPQLSASCPRRQHIRCNYLPRRHHLTHFIKPPNTNQHLGLVIPLSAALVLADLRLYPPPKTPSSSPTWPTP